MRFLSVWFCAIVSVGVAVGVTTGDGDHLDFDDATIKEILDDPELAELLNDPDKLLSMLKRKLRGGHSNGSGDSGRCYVATNKPDTIIKTKESQLFGAVFIAVPLVAGRQDCIDACCNNSVCNTAIFKEKGGEAGCYLFDCKDPNVCVFSEHSGFSSIQFYSRLLVISDETKHVAVTTTTTRTTMKPTTAVIASAGQLYSSCTTDQNCLGGHRIECNNHICTCRHGFHERDGICRQDCGHYEFECMNSGNPELSQCIAVYYRCDGTVHCIDGSDEVDCKMTTPGNHSSGVQNQNLPVPAAATSTVAAIASSSTGVIAISSRNVSLHASASLAPPSPGNSSHGNMQADNHNTHEEDEISAIPVVHHVSSVPVAKGAIVALALGVTIVMLLVMFVGCHLRRARWASGKGRLRRPVDEDYLINGMYL